MGRLNSDGAAGPVVEWATVMGRRAQMKTSSEKSEATDSSR